jgi:hypothetical protein
LHRHAEIILLHVVTPSSYPYGLLESGQALEGHRRNADSKLAVASTTVVTEPDRNLLLLLKNEFSNLQQLTVQYLAMRKSLTYIAPDSLDNDLLNQKIQNCAQGLASMTASGQFQDVATCH